MKSLDSKSYKKETTSINLIIFHIENSKQNSKKIMEDTPLDAPDNQDQKTGKELKSISEIRAFRKLIFKESQEVVDNGASKEAYFEKAIATYGNIHEKTIAQILGFAISDVTKNKHRNFIYALIGLQLLIIVGFAFFVYQACSSSITTTPIFLLVFLLIIECLILSYLLKFNGQILGSLMFLGSLKVLGSANQVLTEPYDISVIISLSISVLMVLIATYLKKKFYPQYTLWGGPKKNAAGNYQF